MFRKLKICYIVPNMDSKDGWGRISSDIIKGMKDRGNRVVVLKQSNDGFEGLPIIKGKGITSIIISSLKALKYSKDCEIIHCLDGYPFGIIGYLLSILQKKKLVITGMGTFAVAPLYRKGIVGFLMKKAYKKADCVVTLSKYTKNEILKKVSIKQIEVIHPGIDVEKLGFSHLETEKEFILGVGALKSRKGYHISIPAFALAKKKIPNLKYKIVGSQKNLKYYNYLKKLTKEYKVEKDVEFLQGVEREELNKLFMEAKIFVLTSVNHEHSFEGFGLVFLEAAACGTPVIGTLGNGIEDAVIEGKNGLLVPQENIEKTSNALIKILSNKKLWKEMSAKNYQWAKKHDLSEILTQYVDVYEKIL